MTSPDAGPVHFSRAAIVGVGLIGSSLARAMIENRLTDEIVGFDADADALSRAHALGVVDRIAADLDGALAGADLVILATPVGATKTLIGEIGGAVADDALVIDVGSVKGAVAAAGALSPERFHFVPSHPVAGTEQSGPEAGFASLFRDRWCILTPLPRQSERYKAAVDRAAALWRAVGSNVEIMDAAHHDLALAVTSHLPHLIAFTLVGAADDLETVAEAEIVKYSAGGFRDFTRIAASDPVMWRDVFLNNKEAVLEVLGRFTEELAVLQRAIRWSDGETLAKTFTRGRAIRRAIVAAGQERDVPNFGRDEKKS
ncbi:MAG: prephenate/arogenate dehydrogenase family protein [Alphaproteobacteria bacterium]|nr:prephenate/arogenate dehydrogenase family protein [Alphaproteobacteria bacterium]